MSKIKFHLIILACYLVLWGVCELDTIEALLGLPGHIAAPFIFGVAYLLGKLREGCK